MSGQIGNIKHCTYTGEYFFNSYDALMHQRRNPNARIESFPDQGVGSSLMKAKEEYRTRSTEIDVYTCKVSGANFTSKDAIDAYQKRNKYVGVKHTTYDLAAPVSSN